MTGETLLPENELDQIMSNERFVEPPALFAAELVGGDTVLFEDSHNIGFIEIDEDQGYGHQRTGRLTVFTFDEQGIREFKRDTPIVIDTTVEIAPYREEQRAFALGEGMTLRTPDSSMYCDLEPLKRLGVLRAGEEINPDSCNPREM